MKKNNNTPISVQLDKFGRKITSAKLKKGHRFHKLVRKRPHKSRKKSYEIRVIAPAHIDFYSPKKFVQANKFVQDLQKAIKNAHESGGKIVKICFRNTVYISAAAAINLFAETDRSITKNKNVKFSITYPPKTSILNPNKSTIPIVDLVLNRLGFYNLLGLKKRTLKEQKNVKCWEHASGLAVDGQIAANLLESVDNLHLDKSQLYRSCVEALANAVEHAYNIDIISDADMSDKRWWMFMAILDGRLVLIICDLGHGIPTTLPKTQSIELINKIVGLFGGNINQDCSLIQAATLVKKTRTDKEYRGKGGKDLTSLVDNIPGSKLSIFSRYGVYRYKGKGIISGKAYNNPTMINGTIVEWSIPLTADVELS